MKIKNIVTNCLLFCSVLYLEIGINKSTILQNILFALLLAYLTYEYLSLWINVCQESKYKVGINVLCKCSLFGHPGLCWALKNMQYILQSSFNGVVTKKGKEVILDSANIWSCTLLMLKNYAGWQIPLGLTWQANYSVYFLPCLLSSSWLQQIIN